MKRWICFISVFFTFSAALANQVFQGGEKDITALAPEMLITLKEQQKFYQQELLKKHPIIVALFSLTGGRFILYRPNQKPFIAKPMSRQNLYVFSSIVEHAAMNAYELSIQGLRNPAKKNTWKKDMQSFLNKIILAQSTIPTLPVSAVEGVLWKN